jgi:hypothetical protein
VTRQSAAVFKVAAWTTCVDARRTAKLLKGREELDIRSLESERESFVTSRQLAGLGTTPGRLEAVFDMVTAQGLSLAAAEAHFDAAVKQREATERLLREIEAGDSSG